MTREKAGKAGRIDCSGENQRREEVDVEEEACDKDGDGGHARGKGAVLGDGKRFKDPKVEQVGKEHVPLEDGDDAHGDEGVEDEEEVVVDLEPIGGGGSTVTGWFCRNWITG